MQGRAVGDVAHPVDACGDDPARAKTGVETPIRVVAQGKDDRSDVFVVPADQQLAVRLDRDVVAVGLETRAAKVGRDVADAAERAVQHPAAVPAHDNDISGRILKAGLHDLAVGLQRNAKPDIAATGAIGVGHGVAGSAAEAGVHAPVGIEAGDRENVVSAAGRRAIAAHDDLAVGLNDHVVSVVCATGGEIGGDDAVGAKTGVQGAVRVVPDQREIRAARRTRCMAREEDLAVSLYDEPVALVRARKQICGHQATGAESGVHTAVAVVARDGEVALAGARHDDLAVRLDFDRTGDIACAAEIGDDDAVTASEARIPRAVGVVALEEEIVVAAVVGVACDQDFSVALHCHRAGAVGASTVPGGDAVASSVERRRVIDGGHAERCGVGDLHRAVIDLEAEAHRAAPVSLRREDPAIDTRA